MSLIALIISSVPLFGSVLLFLLPIPIIYCYLKNGRLHGLLVILASLLISMLLASNDQALGFPVIFLLFAGFLGIVLAEFLKRHYSIEATIFLPVLMLLLVWSSLIFYKTSVSGIHVEQWLKNFIYRNIQDSIALYTALDVPAETIRVLKDNGRQIADFLVNILPAVALISAVFSVWINVLVVRGLLKKSELLNPEIMDLSLWKAPEKLVWFLIAAGMMLLIPAESVNIFGMNILIVAFFIYLLQGLAVTSFFLKTKKIPLALRAIFYFSVSIQQYFTLLVVAIGLFDLWVDFRKRIRPIAD